MRRCSLLALLLLLAISCTDEYGRLGVDGSAIDRTFEASIEAPTDSAGTRTLLGGQAGDSNRSVLWQQGDEVYVTTGSTSARFSNTGASSSKKAVLEGKIADASTYYAFYPYSMVSGYASGKFNVSLPASQRYYAGGIESGSYPMVAQYSNGVFNFRNLCGILVLNLVGDAEVTSITFSGKDSSGNPVKVAGAGTVSTSYSSAPSLAMSSTAGTSVTLDCTNQYTGRGVTLSQSTATPFHIVLPAGTYSSFNLSISTRAGKQMVVGATKALTINRSQRTTTSKLTYKEAQESRYEYVDLGLSVYWATCNVGASKPEDFGDYFAWGETEPYYTDGNAQETGQEIWKIGKSEGYAWPSYQWCEYTGTSITKNLGTCLTKYNWNVNFGLVDNKVELDLLDDAAHVNWGGKWRMPTYSEIQELRNNCTWEWTSINDVEGCIAKSKISGYTDKWIFFPAAGRREGIDILFRGKSASYISSSLSAEYEWMPAYMFLLGNEKGSTYTYIGDYYRCSGYPIRPVCPPERIVSVDGVNMIKTLQTLSVGDYVNLSATVSPSAATNKSVEWTSNNTSVAEVDSNGRVEARQIGTATITVTTEDGGYVAECVVNVQYGRHDYVDLGLSVKWANMNVGANSPEEFGDYFAWGEVEPYYNGNPLSPDSWKDGKSKGYDSDSYKFYSKPWDELTKYCSDSQYGYNGFHDGKIILDPEDDAAHVNWGGDWRMPTEKEWRELIDNCSLQSGVMLNGVKCFKITSKKSGYEDKIIYLPVANSFSVNGLSWGYWSTAYYWSSTVGYGTQSRYISFYNGATIKSTDRSNGLSVRPVHP